MLLLALSTSLAATPVLIDASDGRRALEATRALTGDGAFVDFDEQLRTPGSPAALDVSFADLPGLLRALALEQVEQRLSAIEAPLTASDWRETTPAWLKLWVYRGFARHLRDERDQQAGVADVLDAFSIDPGLQVELLKAERFTRWVEELRARAKQVVTHRLRIDGPEPALVWIDGVSLGATPVEVTLSAGTHLLVATSPGRERVQLKLDVRAAGNMVLPTGAPLPPRAQATRAAVLGCATGTSACPASDEVMVVTPGPPASARWVKGGRVGEAMPLDEVTATALATALSRPEPVALQRGPGGGALISFITSGVLAVASAITFGLGQAAFGRARDIPQLDALGYRSTMTGARALTGTAAALAGLAAGALTFGIVFSVR